MQHENIKRGENGAKRLTTPGMSMEARPTELCLGEAHGINMGVSGVLFDSGSMERRRGADPGWCGLMEGVCCRVQPKRR